ncbi:MAG TPA: hypothetical protein PKA16_02840 [Ottowia sp.]|uniref:hypothetical protein n=1 Tax=Ottowia sp. TaxID=1898956 RepID=UPI002BC9A81A|nr:hypothetical protein [Ottowia sp.]HMN20309.1 hypothetical protein [Ottowia sp.]
MERPVCSAASLPFLARLAPSARAAAPGVHAALPSRFAASGAPEPLVEQVSEIPADTQSRTSRQRPDAATPRTTMHLAGVPSSPLVRRSAVDARERPFRPAVPGAAGAPGAVPEAAAQRQTSSAARGAVGAIGSPSLEPPRHMAESVGSTQHGSPRPAFRPVAEASPPVHRVLPPAEARADPGVRAPLRETVVAQRIAPQRAADAPTVVHVTIDRVDVRVPSPQPVEPRVESRRRSPSTVSLGDYLRQRERSSGGGTP